jgi:hypothetical protein
MFLSDLGLGFVAALLLVVPVTLVTCIGVKKKNIGYVLIAGGVVALLYTLFNWFWFWMGQPVLGFSRIAFNHEYWEVWWAVLIAAVVVGVVASLRKAERSRSRYDRYSSSDTEVGMPTTGSWIIVAALVFTFIYGVGQQFIWNGGRANVLAHEARITMEPANSFPDTDPNNIRQVSEQAADYYAGQVLSSSAHMSTDWRVQQGGGVLQSVANHLYYIYQLYPTGYSNSTKLPDSADPGYVVVDAQTPGSAWLQTKDAYGKPIRMIDYQGGYHSHAIGRFLWAHGFRDQVVSDLTLEVNDQWQPYYTASLEKPTINFNNDVPGSALLINPQNGAVATYPIKNGYPQGLPDWVDRIYSANDVKQMLNWWGEWDQAPYNLINETSNNRYKVVGDPTLVYSDTGHPVWQVQMTSYSSDTGVAYLALFDGRDNHVQMYQIPRLTQDNQAEGTIEGISANTKKLTAVNLTLYKIYGQPTWVASLVCNQDNGYTPCAQQGMAMIPYDRLDGGGVAFASSMQGALAAYEQILTSNPTTAGNVQQSGYIRSVSGKVAKLNQVDSGGNTVWYFMITGDNSHVYSATMPSASSSNTTNVALPFLAVGDTVSFSYLNTSTSSQLRQVNSGAPFSIQGLNIGS